MSPRGSSAPKATKTTGRRLTTERRRLGGREHHADSGCVVLGPRRLRHGVEVCPHHQVRLLARESGWPGDHVDRAPGRHGHAPRRAGGYVDGLPLHRVAEPVESLGHPPACPLESRARGLASTDGARQVSDGAHRSGNLEVARSQHRGGLDRGGGLTLDNLSQVRQRGAGRDPQGLDRPVEKAGVGLGDQTVHEEQRAVAHQRDAAELLHPGHHDAVGDPTGVSRESPLDQRGTQRTPWGGLLHQGEAGELGSGVRRGDVVVVRRRLDRIGSVEVGIEQRVATILRRPTGGWAVARWIRGRRAGHRGQPHQEQGGRRPHRAALSPGSRAGPASATGAAASTWSWTRSDGSALGSRRRPCRSRRGSWAGRQ